MLDILKGLVVESDCLEWDNTLISKQDTFAFGDVERQHVLQRPLKWAVDVSLHFNIGDIRGDRLVQQHVISIE